MTQKSAVINVSMPVEMIAELDKFAAKTNQKRSEFLRNALRRYIRFIKFEEKNEGKKNT